MNASISRFTPLLLAALAVLATGCSAVGSGTVTAAPGSGASSGSAPAGGAPACAGAQLGLMPLGGGLVNGGADIYYIYFKNTGRTACTLRGYPAVAAVTGPDGSASQVGSAATQSVTYPAATQLLQPGQVTQATLRFAKTGNFASPQCDPAHVLFLKIFPPGGTTADYAGGLYEQVCSAAVLPTMTVTTVYPDPFE